MSQMALSCILEKDNYPTLFQCYDLICCLQSPSRHAGKNKKPNGFLMHQSIESPGGGGGGAGNGRAMWGLFCLVHQNAAPQGGDKTNQ